MGKEYNKYKIKQSILDVIEDSINDLLYYDRKEDEDLEVGDIEKCIQDGIITIDEIVHKFKTCLEDNIKMREE